MVRIALSIFPAVENEYEYTCKYAEKTDFLKRVSIQVDLQRGLFR